DHTRMHLEEVLAEITALELPELPGEDRPAHPLDPEPIREGLTRVIGSLLGLGAITFRRLRTPPSAASGHGLAGFGAGPMHLANGFPVVREGLRHLLGRNTGSLVSSGLNIIALTVAAFPLGLVVTGVEALLFLGEVTARRSAWRRYEDRLDAGA